MEFLIHPYSLSRGKSLLHLLISQLHKGNWSRFQAAVAFANQSANEYPDLVLALQKFASQGNSIELTFGCDQFGSEGGSEYLAIQSLVRLFSPFKTAKVYLHHDRNQSTFHPKIYFFSNVEQARALVVIGSSNWSNSAFHKNVEANVVIDLDLSKAKDLEQFQELQHHFQDYWSPSNSDGVVLEVREDNLQGFAPLLATKGTLSSDSPSRGQITVDPVYVEAEQLFGRTVRTSMSFARSRSRQVSQEEVNVGALSQSLDSFLVWEKANMPRSDAQMVGDRSSPTGNLRLSQAGFVINGKRINKKSYFKEEVFGHLNWDLVQDNPEKYEAQCNFHMFIYGVDMGIFSLRISHQPSRVSGQENVPTVLHWGNASRIIRDAQIAGKKLSLYKTGKADLFEIRID